MNEETIKASPTFWLAGIAVAVVGATLAVESRFAKAADVASAKQELQRDLQLQRSYTEAGFLRQRKAMLEDKVFELEAKRAARRISQVEMQQLFRFKAELEDVNRDFRRTK